jgi:PhoH-like ATPase
MKVTRMTLTRKMYVLDTSVLLSSPKALFTFEEHEVVLPLVVIKELEGKRHDPELGFPARAALRSLEELRTQDNADLREGVVVNAQGGTVRIEINNVDQSNLPDALASDRTHDTRILAVANNFKLQGRDVVVVSKDMPMRILSETLGIAAEEYRNEQFVVSDSYTGIVEVEVDHDTVDALYANKFVSLTDLDTGEDDLPINTGVKVLGPTTSALARVTRNKELELVKDNLEAFGVRGRSAEQKIALAHLLDPEIGIVSLGGLAGAGKSFLALAAGLDAVLEQKTHDKVTVFRPLYAVGGQELGFLPGDQNDKMGPWAAAVWDALSAMVGKEVIEEVNHRNLIEVLPLTHIRGRSLTRSYVIIDEAQNLERPVLLTALSRLGEGSKVVLAWDAAQRDNLRVGRHDGIAAVVERLKGEHLFAHTTFTKSERGPIAAMVTRLLDELV